MKLAIREAMHGIGVDAQSEDHPFPATDPKNICNRGRHGIGVQLELTIGLRLHGPRDAICKAIRSVLMALPNADQGRGQGK